MKTIILTIIALAFIGSTLQAQETTAADLMAKGLYEENINRNYTKAEEYYEKILDEFTNKHKIRALAVFHLAQCFEKTGKVDQALQKYEDLIKQYPHEKEMVVKARQKITNSGKIKYFTDERDGRKYKYINIGSQTWMAENLAYLPFVGPAEESAGIWVLGYSGSDPSEASQLDNYKKYGCLYDYTTAQKSCPKGWHLSTEEEWIKLEKYLGYYDKIIDHPGKTSLADNSIDDYVMNSDLPNSGYLSNYTGLSLKRGGFRDGNKGGIGRFSSFFPTQNGYYWGSTKGISDPPVTLFFYENAGHRKSKPIIPGRERGLSVRCIKDIPEIEAKVPKKTKIYHPNDQAKVLGYTSFLVSTDKNDVVDSVRLLIYYGGEYQELAKDYSSLNKSRMILPAQFDQFWLGWNTENYSDGLYDLISVCHFHGGYQDTCKIEIQIANKDEFGAQGTFTDNRDGRKYHYVKIGSQTWMTENLAISIDDGFGSFCYKNLSAHCSNYGRLYTFETAKNACPEGWHLPSSSEWQEMEVFLGFDATLLRDERFYMEDSTGAKIKAEFDWISRYNRPKQSWEKSTGTNSSGFNALPAGVLTREGQFKDLYRETDFWTSTVDPNHGPLVRQLYYNLDCIGRDYCRNEYYAISVRCIKD